MRHIISFYLFQMTHLYSIYMYQNHFTLSKMCMNKIDKGTGPLQ